MTPAEPGHPLWELTKTRLREFLREPGAVFWVFVFPILMAVGLGVAFRNRPADLPRIAVVAEDGAADARALLDSPRLHAERLGADEAHHALTSGKLDLIVEWQGKAPVLRFDPTYERGPLARLVVGDVLQRAAGRKDPVELAEKTSTEPGARYIDFLLPGLIGMNLMGSSMWGIGYNLVVARKRRLLRRYAVTPMRRSHFLLAYFFSRSSFLVLELVALLAFGALVFGTVMRGGYLTYGVVSVLGAASFAAISLIVGARIENSEVANGWMSAVQMPMWVLSGAFFSYERFPAWLHEPIRLLPLTALVDALRSISNAGASLVDCSRQIAVLLAWGAIGFFIALRTFRWQ